MLSCDVVVIGGGPGGYVAAIRAAQRGAKVIVVERWQLGGVCLNAGCIPTKTFIHTANLLHKARRGADFGVECQGVSLNMKALLKHKEGVIRRNRAGIEALFKSHGIQVLKADARVIAPGIVKAGDEDIHARKIIVASGGRPARLPGLEIDGNMLIGSTEALDYDFVPKRVAVIGAGAMGAEFACIWNAFGAEVTLVELMPNVLPRADEELTTKLAASFKKRGIDVRTGTQVAKTDIGKNTVRLELQGEKPGVVEVDKVFVGIGLQCNSEAVTETPGLGIQVNKRGGIPVNDRMETSVPGLYAIGDVIDKTWLAHGASAEGIVAAENATGGNRKMDYRVVPACNFTSPEVASVGMTEKEARAAGLDVKTGRFAFVASGRAQAIGETDGMVKIVGDATTDEIVGVHIMGPEAGELIATAAVAMSMEATVEEIVHTIFTHPTLSETLPEAAEDYFGMGIHTPARKR
ncbi:MAG TPA: dihydrolipoyl dehydrogenase [Candidatus Hydrogenedentes bacterium]|nr:dihydrolipoyl dehydrogenase [Candidatus Hydrogenedentota bacterium]HPC15560.1 dihydrolipoyl dehydrogenase [Candidatus Hydrogenedentota bacterium]HRT19380.1 dihydrolipoyl dehydrogenase [Candidatus Hydrogenedentota bacterium]HRT63886.1 dihydrolipoyl dehydrogenase [Candidatus Hydrogenedentota bacterium]